MMALVSYDLPGATDESPADNSPPRLYNEGTQKLRAGKLREAEGYLQNALASQNEQVRVPALYNLGHARFALGVQELKKSPDANATNERAKQASEFGDSALQTADAALASGEVDALVAAYMHGRGARKELKAAAEAVKRALESYGAVLGKWQRASGDFKSAHELQASDQDARTNAEVVDRHIARLVDTQQLMMKGEQALKQKRQELKEKMGKMKQKLPKEEQQKCSNGDEDEDDEEDGKKEPPKEPKDGQQEPKPKEGREVPLTPEEAARLLDLLKLDANRKLPLGVENSEETKDRKRRTW